MGSRLEQQAAFEFYMVFFTDENSGVSSPLLSTERIGRGPSRCSQRHKASRLSRASSSVLFSEEIMPGS